MSRTRQLLLLLPAALLLLAAPVAFSDEAAVQFDRAVRAYREGDFAKASAIYRQILSQGYESAPLYYNLGNACFKMNRIPQAVLYYERAERLEPDDEDIRHNLALANLRLADRIEPLPRLFFVNWWLGLINILPSARWAVIAVVCLWLGTACAACSLPLFRLIWLRRFLRLAAACALLVSLAALTCAMQRSGIENDHSQAILMAETVSVRSAPDDQSTSLFVLHEGVKLQVLDVVGNWNKIRLADGKVGWIPASAMERI